MPSRACTNGRMDPPNIFPDNFPSSSQLTGSQWVLRARAAQEAVPDRDIVQWQNSQTPSAGLNRLIREAAKPAAQLWPALSIDDYDYALNSSPADSSSSTTDTPRSHARPVGASATRPRPRALRAHGYSSTPSSSMASVQGDPTMFFGLLKEVSEKIDQRAREKQRFVERAREKEREKARQAALLNHKSNKSKFVQGASKTPREGAVLAKGKESTMSGGSRVSTSSDKRTVGSEATASLDHGFPRAERVHASSRLRNSIVLDDDDNMYMDVDSPKSLLVNTNSVERNSSGQSSMIDSPISAVSLTRTQSLSTSGSLSGPPRTPSPVPQPRPAFAVSTHERSASAEHPPRPAPALPIHRTHTDPSQSSSSRTSTTIRKPVAPPAPKPAPIPLAPAPPRPSQHPPTLGMRRTRASTYSITPSQTLPTKQRPFRPPLARPRPAAATATVTAAPAPPPAPAAPVLPVPRPTYKTKPPARDPPPASLPTPNPSPPVPVADRGRSRSPPAATDADSSYGDISIDADLLEAELSKYD